MHLILEHLMMVWAELLLVPNVSTVFVDVYILKWIDASAGNFGLCEPANIM